METLRDLFQFVVDTYPARKVLLRNEVDGPMFKVAEDPRVTRVCRYLRKTSLDELPQLINVLRGEMSLVGPRPLAAEEMEGNGVWRELRLSVKPGITGLWQVKGRASRQFSDWVQYDTEYVANRSLLLDAKILLQTVPAVLRRAVRSDGGGETLLEALERNRLSEDLGCPTRRVYNALGAFVIPEFQRLGWSRHPKRRGAQACAPSPTERDTP